MEKERERGGAGERRHRSENEHLHTPPSHHNLPLPSFKEVLPNYERRSSFFLPHFQCCHSFRKFRKLCKNIGTTCASVNLKELVILATCTLLHFFQGFFSNSSYKSFFANFATSALRNLKLSPWQHRPTP